MDMVSDNDQIISDILAEMNQSAPSSASLAEPASFVTNNDGAYQQDQMNQFAHQVDPHSRIMPQQAPQHTSRPAILKMDTKQSMRRQLLEALKQPLLIALSVYVLFNPFILSYFQKFIPRIWGATDSKLIKHVRILIMAILVSVLYSIIKRFV